MGAQNDFRLGRRSMMRVGSIAPRCICWGSWDSPRPGDPRVARRIGSYGLALRPPSADAWQQATDMLPIAPVFISEARFKLRFIEECDVPGGDCEKGQREQRMEQRLEHEGFAGQYEPRAGNHRVSDPPVGTADDEPARRIPQCQRLLVAGRNLIER